MLPKWRNKDIYSTRNVKNNLTAGQMIKHYDLPISFIHHTRVTSSTRHYNDRVWPVNQPAAVHPRDCNVCLYSSMSVCAPGDEDWPACQVGRTCIDRRSQPAGAPATACEAALPGCSPVLQAHTLHSWPPDTERSCQCLRLKRFFKL